MSEENKEDIIKELRYGAQEKPKNETSSYVLIPVNVKLENYATLHL